eukprot:scaffold16709_cov209-Ochromonas_danica.AAC.1
MVRIFIERRHTERSPQRSKWLFRILGFRDGHENHGAYEIPGANIIPNACVVVSVGFLGPIDTLAEKADTTDTIRYLTS